MSKELVERLRAFAPYASPNAADMMHEAADALEAKAAPVAYITGQFAGRCVIEAINRAAVLPTGMALYATPQPSAVPDGWKLVPVEPTPEMLDAATQDGICVDGKPVWKKDVVFQAKWKYQQMLAAAPSAPKADDPVKVQLLEALELVVQTHDQGGWPTAAITIARAAIAAARKGEGE